MTKEQIIKHGKFVLHGHGRYGEFRINLSLDFFGKEQEVLFANLISLDSDPQMTVVTEIINELLEYDSSNKEWLKDEVWKHYEMCVNDIDYGMVADNEFENVAEANKAYFKIFNREDAYKAIKLIEIWSVMDFTEFRHFNLSYKCPWENEHGIMISVKNGKFDSIN